MKQAQDGAKSIAVGSPIAIIAEEGDDLAAAADLAKQALSEQGGPAKESTPKSAETVSEPSKPVTPESTRQETRADLPQGDRIFASPIAKKIALERGIPLSKIRGSGPDGRIIREDVEKYKAPTVSATSTAPAPATPAGEADYTDIPVTNMRRTIGSRLTQSKQDVPHYYLTVSIDMSKVTKLREVFNKGLAEKDKGAKLSVNDFIVKAVSSALADVPEANTAWLGEVIRQ